MKVVEVVIENSGIAEKDMKIVSSKKFFYKLILLQVLWF